VGQTAVQPHRLGSRARTIVLNGPAGVGKSTTARALAATAANGACIHGDDLRDFVVSRSGDAVHQGLGYRNGASVATNFVEAGYELVVFEYIFESPWSVEHFRSAYRAAAPVHFFTLWASLETIRRRERERIDQEPVGERMVPCYRAIESHLDALGPVIDTEARSTADVVAEIVRRCEQAEGRLDVLPLRAAPVAATG
jgi:chloramphenicol 3-O-phosphotransferase